MFRVRQLQEYMKLVKQSVGFSKRGQKNIPLWHQPASKVHNNELSYPLTKDETLLYLQTSLEIQSPKELLKNDKAAFLAKLIQQMKFKTPFTNIPYLSSKKGLTLLSLHQCKDAMLSRKGGNCMAINSFLKAVLDNLGFKTYQFMGSAYRWRDPLIDNHLAVVVNDLSKKGSKHIVDVGNQFQLCTPVPLNFRRVSLEYQNRCKGYRYFQVSHGIIAFCQEVKELDIKPGKFQQIFNEDGKYWEVLITLRTTKERSLSDALEISKYGAEATDVTGVLYDLILAGYYNDLWISISRRRCITTTASGIVESTRIEDNDQLINTVLKYFPQFSFEEIQNTINNIDKARQERRHKS